MLQGARKVNIIKYITSYCFLMRAVEQYSVTSVIGKLYYWQGNLSSVEYKEFVGR
jgi:hypothetical protein